MQGILPKFTNMWLVDGVNFPALFCLLCLLYLPDLPFTASSFLSLVISLIWQLQCFKSSLTGTFTVGTRSE